MAVVKVKWLLAKLFVSLATGLIFVLLIQSAYTNTNDASCPISNQVPYNF